MIANKSKILNQENKVNAKATSSTKEKNTYNEYMKAYKYTWKVEGAIILSQDKLRSDKDKEILRFLIMQPDFIDYRKDYWLYITGARYQIIHNPHLYSLLLKSYNDFPSPFDNQISLDVKRTFTMEYLETDPYVLEKLGNVLRAYVKRNFSIGYCQGFNLIVGILLQMGFSEEEVFWIFVQIVEEYLPLNFFSQMAGLLVDSSIISKLIPLYLPDLHHKFIECDFEIMISNFIYKWLASLFLKTLRPEISLVIWDCFFLERDITIFKAPIILLKIIKKQILTCVIDDFNTKTLELFLSNIDSVEILHYYLLLRKFEFNEKYIKLHRMYLLNKICDYINTNNSVVAKNVKVNLFEKNGGIVRKTSHGDELVECDSSWPICLHDTDFRYSIIEYSVMKCNLKVDVYDNYFFEAMRMKKHNIAFENMRNGDEITEKDLVIERKPHKCYKLQDNIEISFDAIPDIYIDDIYEDQEFAEAENEDIENKERNKLVKRQGMKCNYIKINHGGGEKVRMSKSKTKASYDSYQSTASSKFNNFDKNCEGYTKIIMKVRDHCLIDEDLNLSKNISNNKLNSYERNYESIYTNTSK